LAALERVPGESLLPARATGAASSPHRKKRAQERDNPLAKRTELQTDDEKLRPFAEIKINFDLDDGVKVSHGRFGDLLVEVKAVCSTDDEE